MHWIKDLSLAKKVTLAVAIVMVISFGIMGFIANQNASKILYANIQNSMSDEASDASEIFCEKLSSILKQMEAIANRNDVRNMDWGVQKPALMAEMQRLGTNRLTIIHKDGKAYTTNGNTSNLADRSYFQKALKGVSNISDPTVSRFDQSLVTVAAVPIKNSQGEIIGVLTAAYDGKMLMEFIQNVKAGQTGYAFILNKDGKKMAHPDTDLVIKGDNDLDNVKTNPQLKELADLEQKMVAGETGFGTYRYNGIEKFMSYAPIKGAEWSIALTVPKSELFKEVSDMGKRTLFLTLLFIVLGCLTLYFVTNLIIIRPIKKIVDAAAVLAMGDTNVSVDSDAKDEFGALGRAFDAMVNGIREQAAAAERIAAGDLSINIQPKSNNDVLSIKLNEMIATINALIQDTAMLTAAAREGRLDVRGNAMAYTGSWSDLVEGFNQTLDAVIGPLNVAAEYVERISRGDIPAKITDSYYGDFNEIKNNLNTCIDAVNALVHDANMLAQAAVEGCLDTRADTTKHGGDFRTIIEGINASLDAIVTPLGFASGYIQKMANGEELEVIENNYPGDYGILIDNLNKVRTSLYTMLGESLAIAEKAVAGQLDARADISNLKGGFAQIVGGFNNTLDAIIEPINEAQQVLGRIAFNDYTLEMKGQYQGKLKELAESINTTRTRLLSVLDAVVKASKGDTSRLEEFRKIGRRSENDHMMPSLAILYQTIENIINEVGQLSQAGINGNLKLRGNAEQFEGGYRQIIEGFNQTLDAFVEPINEASAVLQEMAQGNLQVQVTGDYQGDHAILKDALNHAINAFNDVLTEFNNASEQVASGARNVSDSSQALSQGASEQAATVEEITAAMTEIAAQTKQNAVNANQANDLALMAKENAGQGNEQMKAMLGAMGAIQESSSNISKIIKVIDEIAFQTNILALNAAVEAARAGQHGKGFAVVAEEVRNLAARSANAAKETTVMIEGSIKKVEDGTRIASETADALNKIVDGVAKAATLVGEIAVASNEQATGITQVNQGIAQVSQVTQTNTATSEESASASEELASQAELLKGMIRRFRLRDVDSLNSRADSSMVTAKYRAEAAVAGRTSKSKKVRISLDDQEFGKY